MCEVCASITGKRGSLRLCMYLAAMQQDTCTRSSILGSKASVRLVNRRRCFLCKTIFNIVLYSMID